MAKFKDLVYIKRIEGKEKPDFNKVGFLMEKDDGKLSVKLNAVPVDKDWDGWLSVIEPKKKESFETPPEEITEIEPF